MNTVNGHRRTAIRTRPLPEDALEDLPSSRPGALDDLVEQERVKLLYETLGKLQAVDRDIFFLRVGAELQIKQIAQTLGLKVGTVKSRMNRGMEEIRAIWPDPSVLPGETQSEEDS
jgi:RNA polymerase sigma factor (sigma-70 family)